MVVVTLQAESQSLDALSEILPCTSIFHLVEIVSGLSLRPVII